MMGRHLVQLDGLRGIAILIVVIGHLLVFVFGLGITRLGPLPPAGVDLFFVLSGFLITGILLRARGSRGYFRNFYARRGLRVWPLYYLFLAFMFLIAARNVVPLSFDPGQQHWAVFAFYLQNICYRQASELGPLTLAITWSLAVEEQFYLIWPALVSALSPRGLAVVLGAVMLGAPLARAAAPHFGIDPYINPLCRLDAMAMGSMLAMWIHFRQPQLKQVQTAAWWLFSLCGVCAVGAHLAHIASLAGKSIVSLLFTAVMMLALSVPSFSRILSIRPLTATGRVSYCLYLCHVAIAKMVYFAMPGSSRPLALIRCVMILAVSYGVAFLSWRCLEEPLLRLKRYFEMERPMASMEAGGLPLAESAAELS